LYKCWVPGLEELGVVTYTPGLFTGVGFTCQNIPNESWGDQLLQNGKIVLRALDIIRKLPLP
jgi:hypothetical protein